MPSRLLGSILAQRAENSSLKVTERQFVIFYGNSPSHVLQGRTNGAHARDLVEAVASAQLRAARLEADLLAGLAAAGPLAKALRDHPDARALILRYRREAELSARRARAALGALTRARGAGLLPGEDKA